MHGEMNIGIQLSLRELVHNFKLLIRMQPSEHVPEAQCSAMQRCTREALNKLVQVLRAILLC